MNLDHFGFGFFKLSFWIRSITDESSAVLMLLMGKVLSFSETSFFRCSFWTMLRCTLLYKYGHCLMGIFSNVNALLE